MHGQTPFLRVVEAGMLLLLLLLLGDAAAAHGRRREEKSQRGVRQRGDSWLVGAQC